MRNKTNGNLDLIDVIEITIKEICYNNLCDNCKIINTCKGFLKDKNARK